MKLAKTIIIMVLSVLLALSMAFNIFIINLLGVHSMDALKRVMLCELILDSMNEEETTEIEETPPTIQTPETEKPNIEIPSDNYYGESGDVIFDSHDIKITLLSVEYDRVWEDWEIKFEIENNNSKDIDIVLNDVVLNGYMADSIGTYAEVLSGRKLIDYITISDYELELVGVDIPKKLEFKFHIFNSDDLFDTIVDSDTIIIKFNN